jgi:hypothetical protein
METDTETEKLNEGRQSLLVFWLRMAGYVLAGVGAPITTFAVKFGLFNTYGYETVTDELGNVVGTRVALNGWGIVSVVLAGVFFINVMKQIVASYSGYSMTKQVLMGVYQKILPLAIAIGICYFLKGVLDQILFCLITIGISQIVAIPLNPLPKWSADRGEESYEDLISRGISLFKRRKGE